MAAPESRQRRFGLLAQVATGTIARGGFRMVRFWAVGMRLRIGALATVFAVTAGLPVHAAEMADFLSVWEQVGTNAGPCPTCQIEFQDTPQGAVVIANNGWRADLPTLKTGGPASGIDRWRDERVATWVSGRSFTVSFYLERSGLLAMTMTVDTSSGRQSVIRGSYRRVWHGM